MKPDGPERRTVVWTVLEVAHIEVGIDVDDTDLFAGICRTEPTHGWRSHGVIATNQDRHGLRLDGADGPNGGLDLAVRGRDVGEMAADITQVACAQVSDVGIPVRGVGRVVAKGET
jgi:hypothetical protein